MHGIKRFLFRIEFFHYLYLDIEMKFTIIARCYAMQSCFILKTDNTTSYLIYFRGWTGSAIVLGKLSVPGYPTNLNIPLQ